MSSSEEEMLKEAKKLSWYERLLHRNWKVRYEANIDLASLCDSITNPKDQRLRRIGLLFNKTVLDSNAEVQEKALDALIAFLRVADADCASFAKEVCDAIAAKCLHGRPNIVEKSQAAFLLWIELEATDVFLDIVEKVVKNNVSKAVVSVVDVMSQALREFGPKIIPPEIILKMLPELFDHPDQNVCASSKVLTLELCRWIGKESVESILFEKMRDTMKDELEVELVNICGNALPSRKIRAEQGRYIKSILLSGIEAEYEENPLQFVEALKYVYNELTRSTSGPPDGSSMDCISKDPDWLISCLANKVSKTLELNLTGISGIPIRYVLNALLLVPSISLLLLIIFQSKPLCRICEIAHAVKESTLDSLITELLLLFLNRRVPRIDHGSELLKGSNVLLTTILNNADSTTSFIVLIKLLRPLDISRWPSPASAATVALRDHRFPGLVVKCLIKVTRNLPSIIYELDIECIEELGMAELRKREEAGYAADDKPLRMLKCVLQKLLEIRRTQ